MNVSPKLTGANNTLPSLSSVISNTIQDINAVAIDPNNKEHYAFACMSSGIAEINNNQMVANYNGANSPMVGYLNTSALYVTGVNFDKNSNLWASVSLSPKTIQIHKKDK